LSYERLQKKGGGLLPPNLSRRMQVWQSRIVYPLRRHSPQQVLQMP